MSFDARASIIIFFSAYVVNYCIYIIQSTLQYYIMPSRLRDGRYGRTGGRTSERDENDRLSLKKNAIHHDTVARSYRA
jgi:hypothetical protein